MLTWKRILGLQKSRKRQWHQICRQYPLFIAYENFKTRKWISSVECLAKTNICLLEIIYLHVVQKPVQTSPRAVLMYKYTTL